jgi:3-hydroxyacyl-[acyl-carrier-protein] dehydratase
MLINDLYNIEHKESDANSIRALVILRKDHKIFDGHFPGRPVLPGVCMIQIVREILQDERHIIVQLSSSDSIKFLSVINPQETDRFNVLLELNLYQNSYHVQVSFFSGPLTYFKFKGVFDVV